MWKVVDCMKLKGWLKDKVDKADTMEEKKKIIADAGMELDDDELSMVTGGDNLMTYDNTIYKDPKKKKGN